MKIIIKVKTNAKKESVERVTNTTQNLLGGDSKPDIYKVTVREPPVDGKANKAIIGVLAEYFHVSQSSIYIISGLTSKNKLIEIS